MVGLAYDATISAAGGAGGYTWDIAAGSLPGGISLTAAGTPATALSGTPTVAGTFQVTVRLTDAAGATATQALSIVVYPTLEITTPTLPPGIEAWPYSGTIEATGGTGTGYRWTRHAGALPPGITFLPGGSPSNPLATDVFGTPTAPGTFNVTVRVTDSEGFTAIRAYSMFVNPKLQFSSPPPSASRLALPGADVGVPYSCTISALGGTDTGYQWDLSAGALPVGMTFTTVSTPSTTITGTPTSTATVNFTLRVTDSNGQQATQQFSLKVSNPVSVTTASGNLAGATVGTAYGAAIRTLDGSPPFVWTVDSGQLPPGLALGTDGVPTTEISGVPTAQGSYTFAVRVTDVAGATQVVPYAIDVAPATLAIETRALAFATQNEPYGKAITARGSAGPLTWTVTSGALPPGMTLTSGAALATLDGAPTQTGVYFFTVQADDGVSTASWPFRLEVKAPHRWIAYYASERNASDSEVFFVDVSVPTPVTPGTPSRAVNPVNTDASSFDPSAFSPEGRAFAFLANFDQPNKEVYVVDLSGATSTDAVRMQSPITGSLALDDFIWAPDSRRILYYGDTTISGKEELFMVETAVPTTSYKVSGNLVSNAGIGTRTGSSGPRWGISPDGSKIAYIGDGDTSGVDELYVTDVRSLPSPPTLTGIRASEPISGSNDLVALWWLNANTIVYAGKQYAHGATAFFTDEVVAVDVSGFPSSFTRTELNPVPATSSNNLASGKVYPSPDGQRVLFIGDFDLTNADELYMTDFSTGPPVRYKLNEPFTSTSQKVSSAVWSPDGRWVAFMATPNVSGVNELFVVDVSGATPGTPVRVTPSTATTTNDLATSSQYGFSGDGRLLAYIDDGSSKDNLYLVDLEAIGPTPSPAVSVIANSSGNVSQFRFSADGRWILYLGNLDGNPKELYRSDVSSGLPGGQEKVSGTITTTGGVNTSQFFWSRNADRIYFAGDQGSSSTDAGWMTDLMTGGFPITQLSSTSGIGGFFKLIAQD
jgi:Tol biopolymer transport system component